MVVVHVALPALFGFRRAQLPRPGFGKGRQGGLEAIVQVVLPAFRPSVPVGSLDMLSGIDCGMAMQRSCLWLYGTNAAVVVYQLRSA